MSRYSVCHTTARPQGWQESFWSFINGTEDLFRLNAEYILCMDKRWGFTEADEELALIYGVTKVVWNTGRKCMVDGYAPAVQASTGDVIILNSDDMRAPQDWDVGLDDAIGWEGKVHDFVVQVSSDTPADQRDLMVLQILSRARYERLGYALYPAYEGLFADDEFSEHARLDGVVINAKHLVFKHLHPAFGEAPVDEVYAWQNRTEAAIRGRKIFETRRASRFTVDWAEDSVAVGLGCTPPSLTVCLPGEVFSNSYVSNWTSLLSHLMQRFNVRCVFGYQSDVAACRNWFADRAREAGDDFVLWMDDDNILDVAGFQQLYDALLVPGAPDVVGAWCWIHDQVKNEYSVSCGSIERVEAQAGSETAVKLKCLPGDPTQWDGSVRQYGYTGFPSVLMRGTVLRVLGAGCFTHYAGLPGEDVAFCQRLAEAGLRLGVHTGVRVPHLKLVDMNPSPALMHLTKRD